MRNYYFRIFHYIKNVLFILFIQIKQKIMTYRHYSIQNTQPITNKNLPYSTENYTQSFVKIYKGKESEKDSKTLCCNLKSTALQQKIKYI